MNTTASSEMEKRSTLVTEATTVSDVAPLDPQKAFFALTVEEQQEVANLADSIDVTRFENVMAYGSEVLKRTFDQCGQFLKSEAGSQADQEVIKRVVELTKKASESYDDFELELQEPNFFQKLWLMVSSSARKNKAESLKTHAITNYKLLAELKESCEAWLEMLRSAMGDITYSALSDSENVTLLEKYIIAGEMAKARIGNELEALKEEAQNTGLRAQAQKYDDLKEGKTGKILGNI